MPNYLISIYNFPYTKIYFKINSAARIYIMLLIFFLLAMPEKTLIIT